MDIFVYGACCAEGGEHDAAWKLLAHALKQVYGLTEMPDVAREEKGKPYFPLHPRICFNLSHSHGAVVCAVHDNPVGIDIEKLRTAPKRLASGMDDRDFFLSWTAKEASVKLAGGSAVVLLHDYETHPLCRSFDDFLPGWVVSVCPSEPAEIRFVAVT